MARISSVLRRLKKLKDYHPKPKPKPKPKPRPSNRRNIHGR
jgi:hypothetical protein